VVLLMSVRLNEDLGIRLAKPTLPTVSGETEDVHAIGIIRDITDERWARTIPEHGNARFRALVDTIARFVWFADARGRLELFERPLARLHRHDPYGSAAERLGDTLHPDDVSALGVPLVFCTGYADPIDLVTTPNGPELIGKPLDPAALTAALRRMFRTPEAPNPGADGRPGLAGVAASAEL
jgi:PAS domain-containing protein